MNRALRPIVLLVALGSTAALGCGDGSNGAAAADASTDATSSSACGAIVPLAGSACDVDQQRCEYDGEGSARCGLTALCGSLQKGQPLTWFLDDRSSLCRPNDPACPSSFAALAAGAACPAGITVNAPCAYPEGRCACVPCDPGDAGVPDGGGAPTTWRCHAWDDVAQGCPAQRPVLGSDCAPAGLHCDYRDDCEPTGSGGDFECDGRWRPREAASSTRCTTPACPAAR